MLKLALKGNGPFVIPQSLLKDAFSRFAVWMILLIAVCMAVPAGVTAKEVQESDKARRECFKGQTIYCIALGLAEERSGRHERALELYRLACKNHPTPGHLRACTPLLTLARQMGRLEEESEPLEARCREGNTITCFYLGKEYLKLTDMQNASRHLEPLCRNQFKPPDPDDYGSCYHLAKGYEQTGQWNEARKFYELDCGPDETAGEPSCLALGELAKLEQAHSRIRQQGIRQWMAAEGLMLFLVVMSLVNVGFWLKGSRVLLRFLMIPGPVIVWSVFLVWMYWSGKPQYPITQWAVMGFALLLASGLALLSWLKLQLPPSSPDASPGGSGDSILNS